MLALLETLCNLIDLSPLQVSDFGIYLIQSLGDKCQIEQELSVSISLYDLVGDLVISKTKSLEER